MEEWGGKYNTKGEAWVTLKGICASSDIQLQDVLAEIEKEVMPELETKADIVDEENAETSPLLENEEHNENSGKDVLAESSQVNSKEAAKNNGIKDENDTETTPLNAEIGKAEVVTSDGRREIQGKRQPETANINKSHSKRTQAEQDMIVRTKGYSTDLLDPTQVESKNTIVKSNGLSRVLMLNLWIFSLEKNKIRKLWLK